MKNLVKRNPAKPKKEGKIMVISYTEFAGIIGDQNSRVVVDGYEEDMTIVLMDEEGEYQPLKNGELHLYHNSIIVHVGNGKYEIRDPESETKTTVSVTMVCPVMPHGSRQKQEVELSAYKSALASFKKHISEEILLLSSKKNKKDAAARLVLEGIQSEASKIFGKRYV